MARHGTNQRCTSAKACFQVQYLYENCSAIAYVAPNSTFVNLWIATKQRITAHRVPVSPNVPVAALGIGGR